MSSIYNYFMMYYVNVVITNLIIDYLTILLISKIFKQSSSRLYILCMQILEVCATIICFTFSCGILLFYIIKLVAVILILLLISDTYKFNQIVKMLFMFLVLNFSVKGCFYFLCEVFGLTVQNLFSLKTPKNYGFLIYFMILIYIFAIFDTVAYLEKRKLYKNNFAKLSFTIFGKHIELVGFIDSGNSLYDMLTRKPVVIVSKKALRKYFNESELNQFLSSTGRIIACETISSESMKIMAYDIKNASLLFNKTTMQKQCVIGVVDKVFENSRYDCLLHRDFM